MKAPAPFLPVYHKRGLWLRFSYGTEYSGDKKEGDFVGYYESYEKYERKRKDHVVDTCLATFMQKGLAHTSTKDLCDALHMNSGAVFYYFKNKDDIVIACAEEAKRRIVTDLFGIAIDDLEDPEKLSKDLFARAVAMRALMKFFVTVCATARYEDAVSPLLDKLNEKYKGYTVKIAEKLACTPEEVAPYVYVVINTMLSYMLFGKEDFVAPQLELVRVKLGELLDRKRGSV